MMELDEWIAKLSSEDEADRIYAAEDIGYANASEGVAPLFARLLVEPSRAAREAMFEALRQIEDHAVIRGAIALLDSEDSFLRNQSVVILRVRGAHAIPYLEEAFRWGDTDRRKFVLDTLAKMGAVDATAIYEQALADTDLNILITAIENLGNFSESAFRERVERLVKKDAHPMLLCACIETLSQIGDEGTVERVRTSLTADAAIPGYLQFSYIKLLGAKGSREDLAEVVGLAGAQPMGPNVLNSLSALRSRFKDLALPASLAEPLHALATSGATPMLSYQAVRLMGGLLHVQEIFDFASRCLDNPEKTIRVAAAQALREENSDRAKDVLQCRLKRETDKEVYQAITR